MASCLRIVVVTLGIEITMSARNWSQRIWVICAWDDIVEVDVQDKVMRGLPATSAHSYASQQRSHKAATLMSDSQTRMGSALEKMRSGACDSP